MDFILDAIYSDTIKFSIEPLTNDVFIFNQLLILSSILVPYL